MSDEDLFQGSMLAKYTELLMERDALKKESLNIATEYIREFGELISDSFAAKVEVIRLKKCISYCQMEINKGNHVDPVKMDTLINELMATYYDNLSKLLDGYEAAQRAEKVPEHTVFRVKKLYRRLAKIIHPDLHPRTADDPELMELWERLVSAYETSDLEEMEELEVLIMTAVEKTGDILQIPDLEDKIASVQAEIEQIKTTDPYCYGDLLSDEEAVEDKKENLRKEIREFTDYAVSLRQVLSRMMFAAGVDIVCQEN